MYMSLYLEGKLQGRTSAAEDHANVRPNEISYREQIQFNIAEEGLGDDDGYDDDDLSLQGIPRD